MTIEVKDVIRAAAKNLGVAEGVERYLAEKSDQRGEEDTLLLLDCFHTVENELALDYLPLVAEETVVTATGEIPYEGFEREVARVLCVEDEWGNSLKYRIYPTHCKTSAGKVRVVYAYAPAKKELSGRSDYQTEISARLLSFGVAAEYALRIGDFATASVWDKKYKEATKVAYRTAPCKRLRSRRWV